MRLSRRQFVLLGVGAGVAGVGGATAARFGLPWEEATSGATTTTMALAPQWWMPRSVAPLTTFRSRYRMLS